MNKKFIIAGMVILIAVVLFILFNQTQEVPKLSMMTDQFTSYICKPIEGLEMENKILVNTITNQRCNVGIASLDPQGGYDDENAKPFEGGHSINPDYKILMPEQCPREMAPYNEMIVSNSGKIYVCQGYVI